MTYGAEAWKIAAKSNIEPLEALQNKTLRTRINASWYVRNNQIRRETNTETIRENANMTMKKMEESKNPTMREAVNYYPNEETKYKRPKMLVFDPEHPEEE